MLKLLLVGLRVRHEVHDRARVEDVLSVQRSNNGPAVLPAASARLKAELIRRQNLGAVQSENNLNCKESIKLKYLLSELF